jgi:hypothetical protein
VISRVVAWQYTQGWGTLFTVTVASIALISSVVVGVITLVRNANHFDQGRVDARTDKLRAELIDLLIALADRSSQAALVGNRLSELISEVDLAGDLDFERERFDRRMGAVLSEHIADVYRRIDSHAFGVLLLTDAEDVVVAISAIRQAIEEEQKLLKQPSADVDTMKRHIADIDKTLQLAVKVLQRYSLANLGVAYYTDEQTRRVNKLDLLQPDASGDAVPDDGRKS